MANPVCAVTRRGTAWRVTVRVNV